MHACTRIPNHGVWQQSLSNRQINESWLNIAHSLASVDVVNYNRATLVLFWRFDTISDEVLAVKNESSWPFHAYWWKNAQNARYGVIRCRKKNTNDRIHKSCFSPFVTRGKSLTKAPKEYWARALAVLVDHILRLRPTWIHCPEVGRLSIDDWLVNYLLEVAWS